MSAVPATVVHLPQPLRLRRVMHELNLSHAALRRAVNKAPGVHVSCETLRTLAATAQWPKRLSRQLLEAAVLDALREAGATDLQLADVFDVEPPPPPKPAREHHFKPRNAAQTRARLLTSLGLEAPQEEDIVLMPKQSLTPEARKAFELFTNPFDGEVTRAEEFFATGEIRYVREACWQAAVNARFVAVVGESGSGKTTILADLHERIRADRRPVVLIEPSVLGMEDSDVKGKTLKSADIQIAIIRTLDPLAPVPRNAENRTRQVARLLEESTQAGNQHLLVIEEAHAMPITTLNHLKRLHERMRLGRRPMLGILLLAHPELAAKLNRFDVREVRQRCEVVHLQPLDNALADYLAHRARVAGKELCDLITPDGIEELRARLTVQRGAANAPPISLLYPLAVNNFVTAAINVAADLGAPKVTRDVVRAV